MYHGEHQCICYVYLLMYEICFHSWIGCKFAIEKLLLHIFAYFIGIMMLRMIFLEGSFLQKINFVCGSFTTSDHDKHSTNDLWVGENIFMLMTDKIFLECYNILSCPWNVSSMSMQFPTMLWNTDVLVKLGQWKIA